jgi:hypothetical protein
MKKTIVPKNNNQTAMVVVVGVIIAILLAVGIYFLVISLTGKSETVNASYYMIKPNFDWVLDVSGVTDEQIATNFVDVWKVDGSMFHLTLDKIEKTGNTGTDVCVCKDKQLALEISGAASPHTVTLTKADQAIPLYENAAKDKFIHLLFSVADDTQLSTVTVKSHLSGGLHTFTKAEIEDIPKGFKLSWQTKDGIATKLYAKTSIIQSTDRGNDLVIINNKEFFSSSGVNQVDDVTTYTINLETSQVS